ncbi:MAG: hypothetical protein K5871_12535 [Lachnospiraceae bacterium]|nr:hypothetical protein [Lachnospiraceae bacterium]
MKKLNVFHIIFISLAFCLVLAIVLRIRGWVRVVGYDEISGSDDSIADFECHDHIMPLTDEQYNLIRQSEEVILILGNDPFAEDRDLPGGLAAMLEEASGAEVINCAVRGSRVSMTSPSFDIKQSPWNLFSPYYLACVACGDLDYEPDLRLSEEALGDDFPEEGEEVLRTLKETDLSDVDVIVFFYDGIDYLEGAPTGFDDSRYDDPFCTFFGSLSSATEVLRSAAPGARFIVMSAPYMYHVAANGDWEACEDHPNSENADLSSYVLAEYWLCVGAHDFSFLDNYYTGTNLAEGRLLLTDGRHLNAEGRKVILDRFMYALTYYDEENLGKVEFSK